MQLTLKDDLPFVQLMVIYRDAVLEISNVLVDTGSATTILAADQVARIGLNLTFLTEALTNLLTIVVAGLGWPSVWAAATWSSTCWLATMPATSSPRGKGWSWAAR